MERPGECLELSGHAKRCATSPPKLTKPQKRRKRLQLLAANKSESARKGLLDEPSFQQLVLAHLQNIDSRLLDLDTHVAMQTRFTHPYLWATFPEETCGTNVENILSQLRPDAEEFVPVDSQAEAKNNPDYAIDMPDPLPLSPQLHLCAWTVHASHEESQGLATSEAQCNKCSSSQQDCCCDELYCRRCMKTLA